MDPQAHGHVHAMVLGQAGIQWPQGLHDAQPGPDRALRVILVRLGIAKVDEQAIAEIRAICPSKRAITFAQVFLVGPHHRAQIFRVN